MLSCAVLTEWGMAFHQLLCHYLFQLDQRINPCKGQFEFDLLFFLSRKVHNVFIFAIILLAHISRHQGWSLVFVLNLHRNQVASLRSIIVVRSRRTSSLPISTWCQALMIVSPCRELICKLVVYCVALTWRSIADLFIHGISLFPSFQDSNNRRPWFLTNAFFGDHLILPFLAKADTACHCYKEAPAKIKLYILYQ